jgi:hypothetical protein
MTKFLVVLNLGDVIADVGVFSADTSEEAVARARKAWNLGETSAKLLNAEALEALPEGWTFYRSHAA